MSSTIILVRNLWALAKEPSVVILLVGMLLNCFLNIYVYNHRLVPLSTFIREAICCGQLSMQRLITGQSAKNN